MKFEKFIETEHSKIGNKVWVCDYRYNDITNKPIRHIRPTEVQILDNKDMPGNKIVYYSEIHFRPLSKNGAVLKKVIAPFDNTGYKSNTGTSINVFLTKEECHEHYIKQAKEIQLQFLIEVENLNRKINLISENIETLND